MSFAHALKEPLSFCDLATFMLHAWNEFLVVGCLTWPNHLWLGKRHWTPPAHGPAQGATVTLSEYWCGLASTTQLYVFSMLRLRISISGETVLTSDKRTSPRGVISTFSWGGGPKFFIFFNAIGLLKNWKKQHFICSNLTLFIVPFFLFSLFFSFFLFSFFLSFFSFFLFPWGATAPPAPQNDAPDFTINRLKSRKKILFNFWAPHPPDKWVKKNQNPKKNVYGSRQKNSQKSTKQKNWESRDTFVWKRIVYQSVK